MKNLIIIIVMLLGSVTNAQTFNFGCDVSVRDAREAQLAALVGQHNVTSMTHFESDPGSTPAYVGASYVQNGSPFTFGLSTSVGLIEDITDWSTKYGELVAKLIADSGLEPTTHAHRAGVLTSYNSIDGISNIEVKVDNPINLSVATVYLEWDLNGVAQDTYYFSATNPTVDSNGQVPGDLSYYEPGQFETNRERLYNKLIEHISTLTPFEIELAALYAITDAPPTGFVDGGEIETAASAFTEENSSGTPKVAFIKRLASEYHLIKAVYQNASNSQVGLVHVNSPNHDLSPRITSPIAKRLDQHTSNDMIAYALEVVKAIWLLDNPEYDPNAAAFASALEAIYGAGTPPTELGTIINDAAIAVEFGNTNTPRVDFIKSLAYFNVSVSGVYDYPSKFSEAHLSNSNIVSNIGTNANTSAMTTAQFTVFTLEVVKRFWHIGHPTYAAELEAALRTTRINELEGLSVGNVVVEHGYHNDVNDAFTVYLGIDDFSFLTATYGAGKVENLLPGKYTELKDDIQAKVNVLNPLSDYNLGLELEDFYAKVNIHNPEVSGPLYGNQLPDVIEQLANLAEASDDNDVILEFLKKLSKGAIHQGLDSYLEWYQDTNIIVTNNGGVSNGFYDIPITDGAYLGAGNHQLKDLGPSNVRHLAYHIMSNFWHLANQDVSTLSGFRLQALVVKANSRGWFVREHTTDAGVHYYEPRAGADVAISGFGTLIVSGFQSNAVTLGDLTPANWETFYNKWVEKIDESI